MNIRNPPVASKSTRDSTLTGCALILSAVLAGLLAVPLSAQTDAAAVSIESFAGTWTGLCQDGKPFVILSLHVVSNKIEGTVSIANANYGGSSSNGASCTVQDPASPDHAMPILRTVVEGKKLTMDTRGPQVQIVLTGKDAARLSFPTEDNAEAFFEIHKTPGS
jgi:hypothetical protein